MFYKQICCSSCAFTEAYTNLYLRSVWNFALFLRAVMRIDKSVGNIMWKSPFFWGFFLKTLAKCGCSSEIICNNDCAVGFTELVFFEKSCFQKVQTHSLCFHSKLTREHKASALKPVEHEEPGWSSVFTPLSYLHRRQGVIRFFC